MDIGNNIVITFFKGIPVIKIVYHFYAVVEPETLNANYRKAKMLIASHLKPRERGKNVFTRCVAIDCELCGEMVWTN